ncbi:MAG: 30S ribosomal protein S11 [Candidatus Gribaldobacteria bacterium]|nr:30S ribosomal protein S11 [Candidatus Gribaldobacteria bacterium]
MGKKRIIQKDEKELIAEREKVDKNIAKGAVSSSASSSRNLGKGRVYVNATYNNTIISLTDSMGNVLFWKSAGSIGFKGTKKGTSFASSQVAQAIVQAARQFRIQQVEVYLKGIGGGRDSALKTIVNQGIEVEAIKDVTPVPHNGCRPKKPRRV